MRWGVGPVPLLCCLSGGDLSESRQVSDLANCNSSAWKEAGKSLERAMNFFSAGLSILMCYEKWPVTRVHSGSLSDLEGHESAYFQHVSHLQYTYLVKRQRSQDRINIQAKLWISNRIKATWLPCCSAEWWSPFYTIARCPALKACYSKRINSAWFS